MTNIIQKVIDNKDSIIGIRIDGVFYDVEYVSVDDAEVFDMLADDIIIRAYQVDSTDTYRNLLDYEFTVKDLKDSKEVKLYRLEEI